MKVLFVSSGNSPTGISPIVQSQGESLIRKGIDLDYFTIIGKGMKGYIENIPRLRRFIRTNNYDLIHAHYSLTAIAASLSSKLPLVVSLMGSDLEANVFWRLTTKLFNRIFWQSTIVKSERMKRKNNIRGAEVIPNGIDFELFKPIKKNIAKKKVGYNDKKRRILFIGDPQRPEKNYALSKKAVELLDDENIELIVVSGVAQNILPFYINAVDILLLTSLWEGSPNVIKEAMACNCPIVSTDVGDVKEIIGNTEGCYVSSYDPKDVAEKINKALEFGKMTNGRENIKHLDEKIIAEKILGIYCDALK